MALAAGAATAAPDCEALAERAAAAEGIPVGLMAAVARVESGRGDGNGGRRAWPWTLNAGGEGSFHATEKAALQRLQALLATGTTNVDLGCMQLNWRWHGGAFPDAATMMDPVANTRYAARFLRRLRDESGSWAAAVALYHSRDPGRGTAYAGRVAAEMDRGPPNVAATADAVAPGRPDVAPRLRGLLVAARAPLIGGAPAGLRLGRAPGLGLGRARDDPP